MKRSIPSAERRRLPKNLSSIAERIVTVIPKLLELYFAEKPAVRFKVPSGRTIQLDDKVRGRVEWQSDLLGDFTIARSGGKPLYNLATVVDDIDMQITHIVRAEEHLSNTHPQLHLFEGLGGALPVFAHIPYVAAPGTKKKLSKRNPPPGVMVALEEYEQAGYLPRAVLNVLRVLAGLWMTRRR